MELILVWMYFLAIWWDCFFSPPPLLIWSVCLFNVWHPLFKLNYLPLFVDSKDPGFDPLVEQGKIIFLSLRVNSCADLIWLRDTLSKATLLKIFTLFCFVHYWIKKQSYCNILCVSQAWYISANSPKSAKSYFKKRGKKKKKITRNCSQPLSA